MNARNIAVGGLAARNDPVRPALLSQPDHEPDHTRTSITQFGGMRPMEDPVMTLFYFYPFVLAFGAAWVFDLVHPALPHPATNKGLSFGLIMIILVAIPSNFAMYTSMDWPLTFYIGNLIWAESGFVLTGLVFARIWNRETVIPRFSMAQVIDNPVQQGSGSDNSRGEGSMISCGTLSIPVQTLASAALSMGSVLVSL